MVAWFNIINISISMPWFLIQRKRDWKRRCWNWKRKPFFFGFEKAWNLKQWMALCGVNIYLATKRTETVWIKKATLTDFTSVGDSFTRPWLRPLIQENNPCTVDNVGLDPCNVQNLLNLVHPNHIMVWGPSYLSPKEKTEHIRREWTFVALKKHLLVPRLWLLPIPPQDLLKGGAWKLREKKGN